jgi:hypothetical protein
MEERFWSKVRRGGDDECWEWAASKDKNGYGAFSNGKRIVKAHRLAWELTHGEIPEGLIVRHRCRGKCVNPAHLELGTPGENSADMIRDGTSTRGETNPHSILTEAQVREIKQRFQRGMSDTLATEYGVSKWTIYHIVSGQSWAWVT